MKPGVHHIGRSWGSGRWLEDECPCPQEACGLIATNRIDPDCPQHHFSRYKTIRQSHHEGECPGHLPTEDDDQ